MPLKIESTDRRYAVNRASRAKCGDLDYFEEFAKLCMDSNTQRCLALFYKHLLSLDLSHWNPRKIPMTPEKREMMTVVIEPEWGFFQSTVEDGDEVNSRVVSTNVLFNRFMSYCTDSNTPTAGKTPESLIKVI